MNKTDIRTFSILGVLTLLGLYFVVLPNIRSDTAGADGHYYDWDECMDYNNGDADYCESLGYTPPATPTSTIAPTVTPRPTNTPRPTATSDPGSIYDDWDDCVSVETEAYCEHLGFTNPYDPTHTPTPVPTSTPNTTMFTSWEDCMEQTNDDEDRCFDEGYSPPATSTPVPTATPFTYNSWEHCTQHETEAYCISQGFIEPPPPTSGSTSLY